MKKTVYLFTLTLLLFSAPAIYSQTSELPSEFQSWNEVQLIVPVTHGKDSKGKKFDKITATFTGILRIGRSNWDFLDNRAGITLDFRVNKYLTLMTSALYRKDELVKNQRRNETRLDFGFVLSKTWKNFTFKDRNMYEHRFRNSRADTNLYRNRLVVSHPIKHNDRELFSPFISNEGYFDLKTKKWVQNEFFAGISRKLNSRLTLDLAYIRNDSAPTNVNGFSTSLKIKLR